MFGDQPVDAFQKGDLVAAFLEIEHHTEIEFVALGECLVQGHDSFLFPIPLYVKTLRAFLGGEQQLQSTPQEVH